MRSAAQMISYEVSIGFVIITVLICVGSLNLIDIVESQKNMWFAIPLLPMFVIFIISALAETNRLPFDLPEDEATLVAGFFTEYSSISFGLFLFSPKLVRVVGSQITKLNQMRAYCVALSAAITVIVASWLGLPVSSTHIAVGSVFGVGFFREWDSARRMKLAKLSSDKNQLVVAKEERARRKLVRRSHFMSIIAAWIITVPSAAVISGVIYSVILFSAG